MKGASFIRAAAAVVPATKQNMWQLLLILLSCSHICEVNSAGYMSIQFLQFVSGGQLASGALCDGATTSGGYDPCDPQFSLTVGREDRLTFKPLLDYKQVEFYFNQDTIHFGPAFGQLPNPVIVGLNYDDNQGTVSMSIEVKDIDTGTANAKLIASFSANLKASGTESVNLVLRDGPNRSITLNYWFACSANYYGQLCNTYCRAANDNDYGHNWCTSTGQKACLYGWVDASTGCKKPHPCRTCVCQNGGTCVPQAEGYSCLCPPDFSGSNCQTCDPKSSRCSSTVSSGSDDRNCDLSTAQTCPVCQVCVPRSGVTGAAGRAQITSWLVSSAVLLLPISIISIDLSALPIM